MSMLFDDEKELSETTVVKTIADRSFFLSEESIFSEGDPHESDSLSEAVKKSSNLKKVANGAKVVAKAPDVGLKKAKDAFKTIYDKPDEELVRNEKNVFKLIRRYILIGGIAMVNPAVALLYWYVNKRVRLRLTQEQKEDLLHNMKTEVTILDEKIKEETDKEKRYKMMKLKANYLRSIEKIRTSKME